MTDDELDTPIGIPRVAKYAGPPITVDAFLNNPDRIARHYADQRRILAVVAAMPSPPPRPPLTRRQRARRRLEATLTEVRERIAVRIAPWLEDHDR